MDNVPAVEPPMKRMILMGAVLVGDGVLAADLPPPAAKSWTPPVSVWRDATPIPVLQPAPLPGVPAPSAPAPLPTPAPPTPASTPKRVATPAAALPRGLPQLVAQPMPAQTPPQLPTTGAATTPLPMLLSTPLPTTPSVPPVAFGPSGSQVIGEACATGDCGPTARGSRLARLCNWLAFQPGPPVLPTCQPARYEAPVRDYFPCVAGAGCGPNGCAAPGNCAPGVPGLGAHLGGGGLRNLIAPAGRGGVVPQGASSGAVSSGGGGVLGPIAGGCGTPGLIQNQTLSRLAALGTRCDSDGCVAIKDKGLGRCSEPSDAAPVTGPICVAVQAVGVPLPASCVGSPTDYTGCYAGCDTAGEACRAGAGGRLLGLVFGTCHGGCSRVAAGGNGFAPTSIVPVVSGYARPQSGKYRFADPLSTVNPVPAAPGVANPQLGQPQVDTVGPGVTRSSHTDPAKPFTRP